MMFFDLVVHESDRETIREFLRDWKPVADNPNDLDFLQSQKMMVGDYTLIGMAKFRDRRVISRHGSVSLKADGTEEMKFCGEEGMNFGGEWIILSPNGTLSRMYYKKKVNARHLVIPTALGTLVFDGEYGMTGGEFTAKTGKDPLTLTYRDKHELYPSDYPCVVPFSQEALREVWGDLSHALMEVFLEHPSASRRGELLKEQGFTFRYTEDFHRLVKGDSGVVSSRVGQLTYRGKEGTITTSLRLTDEEKEDIKRYFTFLDGVKDRNLTVIDCF